MRMVDDQHDPIETLDQAPHQSRDAARFRPVERRGFFAGCRRLPYVISGRRSGRFVRAHRRDGASAPRSPSAIGEQTGYIDIVGLIAVLWLRTGHTTEIAWVEHAGSKKKARITTAVPPSASSRWPSTWLRSASPWG